MKRIVVTLLAFSLSYSAAGQNADLVAQANKFLASLNDQLREKAQYAYDHEERFNWNFVPLPRKGVSFHDLNSEQQQAGLALLNLCLSQQGYRKATGILSLEVILKEIEGRPAGDSFRDPKKYYITFFGMPAADKAWGWRFEGHHISMNFSSLKGMVEAATPSFFGSNPAIVPSGPEKGKQVLKDETDLGYALVNSLTKEQQQTAIFSQTALPEIVTTNQRKASALEPKGISFTALNPQQKEAFLKLLDVYVKNYQLGFSSRLMEKIKKAGIENLSFAWAGGLQQGPGAAHYYRIQGPMLLIEYDNTQNNANHVHSSVRDLTNDFAEDILREHYQKEH